MQFSLIVPVYNVEKYLKKCIDSILDQSFKDFEVLLIDDGSIDQSGALCEDYAGKDNRIKVIHQENRGLSGARNTGLEHASGEWIIFIDSDDWVSTDYLEVVNKTINRSKADVYCINSVKVSEDEKSELEKLIFFVESDVFRIDNENERFDFYEKKLMQYKFGWEAWSRVFKRDIIEKYHLRFVPTKEVFAEDYLFTLIYFLHVKKIGCICNCFYYYRQRSDSLLGTKNLETVLKRIVNLNDIFYKELIHLRNRNFKNNYWKLYFHLLNYHIQYMFKEVSKEEIMGWLAELPTERNRVKNMEQIKANCFQLRKYMVNHIWI